MKNLLEYEVIRNETFYKCWHILEYIESHPDMSALDKEAIKATIMDALVTKAEINPATQSLDLDNLCIVNDLEHYVYEEHPNICGIPLWMKEEFRKKALYITGGEPISIFLAKPPSKLIHYCLYDPNIAVSSIFPDATFYEAIYDSPTRGIRLEETRPFVEVEINGELYLVDVLTKRILKSSWFKQTFNFETTFSYKISELSRKNKQKYNHQISEYCLLEAHLRLLLAMIELDEPENAELKFEVEQSKTHFPENWKKSDQTEFEIIQFLNRIKLSSDN